MNSTHIANPSLRNLGSLCGKQHLVFKDLSGDLRPAVLSLGGNPAPTTISSKNTYNHYVSRRGTFTATWQFPVMDVLEQINCSFPEPLCSDTGKGVESDDDSATEAQSECELRSAQFQDNDVIRLEQSVNRLPVDDLIAHVDRLFDNPLDLSPIAQHPEVREGVESELGQTMVYDNVKVNCHTYAQSIAERVSQKPQPAEHSPPQAVLSERGYKLLKSSSRVSNRLTEGRSSGASLYKVLKTFARLGKPVEEPSNGKITSLGKFILDNETEQAIASIIEDGGTQSARILTEQQENSLRDHLLPIANQPGVAGYMVVGYDGLIVTSTLPPQVDGDAFSAWALVTYMHAQEYTVAIGHKRMRQLVSKTETGCLLLCDFGEGLLIAVSDNAATESIIPLLIKARKVRAA